MQVNSLEPVLFLQRMGFCRGFGENRLQKLATHMTKRSIAFNTALIKDTDAADNIFLVKSGELKIQEVLRATVTSESRASHMKITRTPIAIVGEGDALDEEVFCAELGIQVYGIDAIANTDNTVVYELPRAAIEKVSDGLSSWAKHVQEKAITRTRLQHRNQCVDNIGKMRQQQCNLAQAQLQRQMMERQGDDSLGGWSADYRIDPRNVNIVNDFRPKVKNVPDSCELITKGVDHSHSANGREHQKERSYSIDVFRKNRKTLRITELHKQSVKKLTCELVGLTENPTTRSRSALSSLHPNPNEQSALSSLHPNPNEQVSAVVAAP